VGFGGDVVYVFTIIDVDMNTHGLVVATSLRAYFLERSWVQIPLGPVFNLILVRREMYVRLCGEGGIEKAEHGMGMTEHGMAAYPLLP
jgi:hypothetical protein